MQTIENSGFVSCKCRLFLVELGSFNVLNIMFKNYPRPNNLQDLFISKQILWGGIPHRGQI